MIARTGFAFVIVTLFFAAAASAEIYRWTDASGREHFSMHLADVPEAQCPGLTGLDACSANEAAIERAEEALANFEDLARSKDVPPGWLR